MAYTHEEFLKQVYDLVGDEYTILTKYENTNKKIKIKHNICGHIYKVTPNKFKQGRRCPKCSGLLNITHEEFLKQVYDLVGDEYTVLEEYKSTNKKITMQHNTCGHIYKVTPNHFKNGNRCPKCSKISKRKCNTEGFKQKVYDLVGDEYTVLEEYITNKKHVKMKHNKCGKEYKVRPDAFINGHRCPKCSCHSGISNLEKQVIEFIKNFYELNIIENSKSIIKPLELDMYFPDKNIAIEFDGLYWHSEQCGKDKNYHLNKTIECESKGIQLIHIFEDEWNFKQDIVKSKLKYLLGYSKELPKIRASKCFITELSPLNKDQFLEENHIQGKDKSSIKLGLWYPINDEEDRLIAVMTFCKPRKALGQSKNSKYDYELSRFATDIEYQVYGAFDKLFKYFKENYEWSSIITYADRRWSKGNLYENTGFKLIHISKSNYWYFNKRDENVKRYHRYHFRKSELKKKFPDLYNENLTEFEIMDKTNYYRIWDCGNLVYEYKR